MGYVKDGLILAGATLVLLVYLIALLAALALPVALIWYVVTH